MSPRSGRVDLHALLAKEVFDHAVLCSFAFDPDFFEGYCLEHFKSLQDNNNISVLLDARTYDDLLTAPMSQRPRQANVRYLLHAIAVPGIFHPKIFLLASKRKGMLIIGSANLTRSGLTSNAELVAVYRFEVDKNEVSLPIFQQAMGFLTALAARWPSPELTSNLNALINGAGWIGADHAADALPLRLVHNLTAPIWEQILFNLDSPVERLDVLSRFFDARPNLLDGLSGLLPPGGLTIWTQNGITTMTSQWLEHPLISTDRGRILLCSYQDGGHHQRLHAKAIALTCPDRTRIVWGSANFTSSALMRTASDGNLEVVLVSDHPPVGRRALERLFDPDGSAIPLTHPDALRTAARVERTKRSANEPFELASATLSEGQVTCVVHPRDGTAPAPTHVVLTFHDLGRARLPVISAGEALSALARGDEQRFCDEGTTVVHLETDGTHDGPVSNSVFLINLLDVETGKNQRRERRIREAQQSAQQFTAVLIELIREGDTDALKRFLTLCDIPLAALPRPILFARGRDAHVDGHPIRVLGARNLRDFATLHDAAISFCRRHLRKLQKHCGRPTIRALPNFMHIALAVANVVASQLERAIVGLELANAPLDVNAWFAHRERMDEYVVVLSELVVDINVEFLPWLQKRYDEDLLRDAIAPDVEPLTAVLEKLLGTRQGLDLVCSSKLRIKTPGGPVVPELHRANRFHPVRWLPVQAEVHAALARVRELAA
jgi:hypothetical protein